MHTTSLDTSKYCQLNRCLKHRRAPSPSEVLCIGGRGDSCETASSRSTANFAARSARSTPVSSMWAMSSSILRFMFLAMAVTVQALAPRESEASAATCVALPAAPPLLLPQHHKSSFKPVFNCLQVSHLLPISCVSLPAKRTSPCAILPHEGSPDLAA